MKSGRNELLTFFKIGIQFEQKNCSSKFGASNFQLYQIGNHTFPFDYYLNDLPF
jgi:hypothetical protein